MNNMIIKYVLSFMVFFSTMPFSAFCQNKPSTVDSGVFNNAALSQRYFNKFYSTPVNPPKSDSIFWDKTIIILNDEKILSKNEFLDLKKNRILSIKRIFNPGDSKDVQSVILIKAK